MKNWLPIYPQPSTHPDPTRADVWTEAFRMPNVPTPSEPEEPRKMVARPRRLSSSHRVSRQKTAWAKCGPVVSGSLPTTPCGFLGTFSHAHGRHRKPAGLAPVKVPCTEQRQEHVEPRKKNHKNAVLGPSCQRRVVFPKWSPKRHQMVDVL